MNRELISEVRGKTQCRPIEILVALIEKIVISLGMAIKKVPQGISRRGIKLFAAVVVAEDSRLPI